MCAEEKEEEKVCRGVWRERGGTDEPPTHRKVGHFLNTITGKLFEDEREFSFPSRFFFLRCLLLFLLLLLFVVVVVVVVMVVVFLS